MSASVASFYDDLAELYHLIHADWEASIARQAAQLEALATEPLGPGALRVLDVSCGIGTQALGLAARGHLVSGTDLSPASILRATREAETRGLALALSVADMRAADRHPDAPFDLVVSADNALPHLPDDPALLEAFRALRGALRPGGLLLASVRDYAAEDMSSERLRPYGVREVGDARVLVFQRWIPRGRHYEVVQYFVLEDASGHCEVRSARATYYAVGIERLLALLDEAGFADVERIDGRFFQPVMRARNPQ